MAIVKIDGKACAASLRDLAAGVRNAIVTAVRVAVTETTQHARATKLYDDRTGATRQSTTGEAIGFDGMVSAGGATRFLENGTPAHAIEPKNAKTLRFVQNGTVVFRARVQHPGTAERPFMQQARDHGERVLDYGAEHLVDETIKRA